ncbi:MAG: dihydrofolate reductase family protein [Solirubrobacterales bacterium]|nr:dihydrofolate reductase family protein [Solirubrobacterales bacterium]
MSELTKLFPAGPDAARVGSREAYSGLEFGAGAPEDRPYVVVNMVATADGQGRIGKNTAELGGAADADLFSTLRERVDCVMAGIGTIAAESYNAPATKPEVQERRAAAGLSARPLVSTVTRSGELPIAAPMFADAELRIALFSEVDLDFVGVAAQVDRIATTSPPEILRTLRHDYDVRSLLLEGGPHLNTPFFAEELVDELFLTVAPVLIGNGDPFPIIAGRLPRNQKLHLISAFSGDEHLFLRYRVD